MVVAVTGGSGAGYARRLVRVLLEAGYDVHLT
ncbi:MAG TPA: 3-octaprenyl-4-hydroxybenzoate carboxy-lyase, partial [Planctomycetaceae bacterium]|nr:3-octaprenyl-4-hydroxybenzoate carboxy-lyase [Planctomycetaceae bacterium]